jgi:hypothetical protein
VVRAYVKSILFQWRGAKQQDEKITRSNRNVVPDKNESATNR